MRLEQLAQQKAYAKEKTAKIEDVFASSNPHMPQQQRVIRDYVYVPRKRVI